jgi:hypothetical protein
MKKITINDNEVGKEYLEQLEKIVQIRKERRKKYKDSFLDDDIDTLLTIIKQKIKRFEISDNSDDLIDACNYLIFILCNLEEKNGKN